MQASQRRELAEMQDRFEAIGRTSPDLRIAMLVEPSEQQPSREQYRVCVSRVCGVSPLIEGFSAKIDGSVLNFVLFGSCSQSVLSDFKALSVTTLGHLFAAGGDTRPWGLRSPRPIVHEHWLMLLFSTALQNASPRFARQQWVFSRRNATIQLYGQLLNLPGLLSLEIDPELHSLLRKKGLIDAEPLRQDELVPMPEGPSESLSAVAFQHNLFTMSAWVIDALSPSQSSPPLVLTPLQQAVFDLIQAQPPGKGLTAKEIIALLKKQDRDVDSSTLTRHIIPALKEHGVVNHRNGRGYLIERT